MFDTVLVAGRGVTALRVVRTCARLGVQAIAVHADDDARAPHVLAADDAVPLGGSSDLTYRDTRKLLEAARRCGAQAVHPCDGAVSRDATFAGQVVDAGLVWLGPPAAALAGAHAPPPATGRRVTVTVLARGDVAECLGQRGRLGLVLDEEPATATSAEGQSVLEAAVRLTEALQVPGVCAVDVVLAPDGPVATGLTPLLAPGSSATAAVAGVDLVDLQVRLAAGEKPPPPGERAGHALALQLRAADRFAGRLRRVRLPTADGVRTDAGVAEGSHLTALSDRLLAVLTVTGRDRDDAVARARAVLDGVEVAGVPTNLSLLRSVLDDPSFRAGAPDAALLERIDRP